MTKMTKVKKVKKVLVYPCGTEIALEIHKALRYAKNYKLIGGVDSSYDHGRFVYRDLIENLPFIKDDSTAEDVANFEEVISAYDIDFIYPAMDGVIAVFAKYRSLFKKETLIISDAAEICRSKRATYQKLQNIVNVPVVYTSADEITNFPVFIKPDKGQGSVGARKINSPEELKNIDITNFIIMEYLPGKEYTVDCFTNAEGKLIYAKGRSRKRIKSGISVNAVFEDREDFRKEFQFLAQKINEAIRQKGGWFFQVREDKDGKLKLLEVAARIAGASAISRNIGANLPLMTVDIFNGIKIDDVALNDYDIELDRALKNSYKINLQYSHVYIDYDDTLVQGDKVNLAVVTFLYQCVNKGIKIILLSKHDGDLDQELEKHRLGCLFDEVIHIPKEEQKYKYIGYIGACSNVGNSSGNNSDYTVKTEKTEKTRDSIFIDDSYGERKAVKEVLNIPVFDTHMIECLLEE